MLCGNCSPSGPAEQPVSEAATARAAKYDRPRVNRMLAKTCNKTCNQTGNRPEIPCGLNEL